MASTVVLSVDDDKNLQLVLEDYLEDAGYVFMTAASLDEAIQSLRKNTNIKIVLLDLTLPDGEGLSLIPKIKTETSQD